MLPGEAVMDPRVLVIANRTADSDELLAALRARAEQGPVSFTLVAPATPFGGGLPSGRAEAHRRMRDALAAMEAAGLEVEGHVGDPDPYAAAEQAWDPARFSEVIVATLPLGISRWLQVDLPHRVQKLTGAPLTHVVAQEKVRTAG
jgi:sugar phosphate isomerase/epimerase